MTEQLDPEHWVDRHGDVLYRYALMRVRSAEAAAEVVQEVFVEALRNRDRFQGRSSERTWLVGILKHKVIDHLRRSGKQAAQLQNSSGDDFSTGEPFFRNGRWLRLPRFRADHDPASELERQEFWQDLGRCLERLPPHLADAFLLRELEGIDSQEICQIMGITPTNLWARLHRARLQLRQCLEQRWGNELDRA